MRKSWKVRVAGFLCILMAGSISAYGDVDISPHPAAVVAAREDYSNIAVSQVTDYVNIREQANTSSRIVGKIYNNCAAVIQETVEGEGGTWYRIQSGTVTGYIKAQYFITGEEAEKLAQSIRREFITVNAENLRLREQPNVNSAILTVLSQGARYVALGKEGGFYKVEVDADLIGYVSEEYCKTQVEFDQAVSLEEERQKAAEEAQRKRDAANAIAALQIARQTEGFNTGAGSTEVLIAANPESSNNSSQVSAPVLASVPGNSGAGSPPPGTGNGGASAPGVGNGGPSAPGTGNGGASAPGAGNRGPSAPGTGNGGPSTPGSGNGASVYGPGGTGVSVPGSSAVVSATRTAIVAYAKQFLGNPYVFGGSSLTDGTDCSGFTQAVFANFGITTGRSSRDQAVNGREIAIDAAQPGDLLFYASGNYINHVALYIGGGQVIHAANSTTGIVISPYNYRTPCKAVTFLE